jgi:hypothetical protein
LILGEIIVRGKLLMLVVSLVASFLLLQELLTQSQKLEFFLRVSFPMTVIVAVKRFIAYLKEVVVCEA